MTDLVRVKNKDHGGIAALPESALQHLENWEQQPDGPPPSVPKPRRELRRLQAAAALKSQPDPESDPEADPSATSEKE